MKERSLLPARFLGAVRLHLGVASLMAGAVLSWSIAALGVIVAVAVAARHRRCSCDVVIDTVPLPATKDQR